ncbi:MAG: hypothetical protein FWB71_00080 [Defluviitaleaceae bacterium]|nr:hypothetical protein [Defluviitaleaceae bacterium]
MIRVNNIKLRPEEALRRQDERRGLKAKAARALRVSPDDFKFFSIARKSVDARDRRNVHYVYSIETNVVNKAGYLKGKNVERVKKQEYGAVLRQDLVGRRPLVVGAGPGGLFAALILAEAGQQPIVIERGKAVDERVCDVSDFFDNGRLDPESNVQFGEGGAGTFSDGKLTADSRDIRAKKVFAELLAAGAPPEIAYLAKPHIGTDRLRRVIPAIREKIIALGGEFRFSSRLVGIETHAGRLVGANIIDKNGENTLIADHLILAIGHSARDTFEWLHKMGLVMSNKPFAVGLRIEHPQAAINRAQYGDFAHQLPPADYKLTHRTPGGRSVYSFCMCPGGVVIPASSEAGHLCINGMSDYARNSDFANAAIVAAVDIYDFGNDPLAGINFQRDLEAHAHNIAPAPNKPPTQPLSDFLQNSNFLIPNPALTGAIAEAIAAWDAKIRGFADPTAILTAIESRTSSPIRIPRDEGLNSSIRGLIPCGEGAGHAGGIISAAIDGIKCAEAVLAII